jgi:hypothetical protein
VAPTDFDLLAASLRADAGDLKAFVEVLATKLTESFPAHVRVERKGGLLGGGKRVRRISTSLGDEQFDLEHDDGRVACSRRNVVRGIALKTDELELQAWIEALSKALVREAESTERGREALERLLN